MPRRALRGGLESADGSEMARISSRAASDGKIRISYELDGNLRISLACYSMSRDTLSFVRRIRNKKVFHMSRTAICSCRKYYMCISVA